MKPFHSAAVQTLCYELLSVSYTFMDFENSQIPWNNVVFSQTTGFKIISSDFIKFYNKSFLTTAWHIRKYLFSLNVCFHYAFLWYLPGGVIPKQKSFENWKTCLKILRLSVLLMLHSCSESHRIPGEIKLYERVFHGQSFRLWPPIC